MEVRGEVRGEIKKVVPLPVNIKYTYASSNRVGECQFECGECSVVRDRFNTCTLRENEKEIGGVKTNFIFLT